MGFPKAGPAQVHPQLLVPGAVAAVLAGSHHSLTLAWNLYFPWNFPLLPRKTLACHQHKLLTLLATQPVSTVSRWVPSA